MTTSSLFGTPASSVRRLDAQTRTLTPSDTSQAFSRHLERAVTGDANLALRSDGGIVSPTVDQSANQALIAEYMDKNVPISLGVNPFNPTGKFVLAGVGTSSRSLQDPVRLGTAITYCLDGTATTAPGINPDGWGIPMAGAGRSFLPFQPSYLTGTSPSGGPYAPGYVSPETAQKMVEYIGTLGFPGARVSEGPGYGLPDQASPGELQITLTNGQQFGANGLLDELAMYGPEYVKQLLSPNTKQLLSSMGGPAESFIPPKAFGG